jgi:N-acyl-D-aspartate/D-glutamate deacylase
LSPDARRRTAPNLVTQGITTVVGNPDGRGPTSIAEQKAKLAELGIGLNAVLMIGHNTVRQEVMGTANRPPTPDELQRMRDMVAQSMGQGAFGLSTGLRYIPGFYSNTDEVVRWHGTADSGGIYASHLCGSGRPVRGVAEALEIRRAHIRWC